MSSSILNLNNFSWGFLGKGISAEIASWTLGSITCYALTGKTVGDLINKIIPQLIKNVLSQTSHAIGNHITGPMVKRMEGCGILNTLILAPAFEELVFRGVIQQSLVAGLETTLHLGGVSDSLALTAAKVTGVILTAYLFAVSHEPFNRETLETPGGSARFIRAIVRGAIVENSTIYEAIGMHAVNNFIGEVHQRVILIRTVMRAWNDDVSAPTTRSI